MSSDLRRWIERKRFAILLVSLVALAVLPALPGNPDNQISGLLLGVVLVAAVNAANLGLRSTVAFGGLAVMVFGGRLASVFGPRFTYQDPIDAGSYLIAALFLGATLVIVFRAVLRAPHVNGDTVMGAVCVYLLIGYTWANLYALVHLLDPGSFNFPAYAQAGGDNLIPEFTFGYYSMVTLTTLGYGDVTPITYRARTLSWLEAVVGVTYMATVIAFLVSQVVMDREGGRRW